MSSQQQSFDANTNFDAWAAHKITQKDNQEHAEGGGLKRDGVHWWYFILHHTVLSIQIYIYSI